MQDDVVADDAVVINGDVGIEKAVVAYLGALFNDDMGVDLAALAYDSIFADVGKRTYIGILANLCGFWAVGATQARGWMPVRLAVFCS